MQGETVEQTKKRLRKNAHSKVWHAKKSHAEKNLDMSEAILNFILSETCKCLLSDSPHMAWRKNQSYQHFPKRTDDFDIIIWNLTEADAKVYAAEEAKLFMLTWEVPEVAE